MTDPSESEHPRAVFLRALGVGRNAVAGFALGTLFAAFVFVWFVYIPDRRHPLVAWLMLAFVLAIVTGLLLTLAFTLATAVGLVRGMDDAGDGRGAGTDQRRAEGTDDGPGPGVGDGRGPGAGDGRGAGTDDGLAESAEER